MNKLARIVVFLWVLAFVLFGIFPAVAQDAGAPMFAPMNDNTVATQPQAGANLATETSPAASDPTLTTHETAVECAMALIVESAGERHVKLSDPAVNSFRAGLCAGKIQTYMLSAKAANPDCFPKLELEEGMRMFVKWAEAHPEEGATMYPDGFKKAFEDAIPCLKK